jgi:hypothetical protein
MSIRIKGNPSSEQLNQALETLRKNSKVQSGKKLEKHFGRLKRGLDGVEYQNALRHEWD